MCSHDNVTIYYRYKTKKQNFIKYEIIIKRRIEEAIKNPNSIRQQVIRQWLQGTSRDRIAKDNGIGAGTVSAIIKESDRNDIRGIDLLREVAIVLKKKDLDLFILASSIRLSKKIDKMDLSEDIHCFKHGLAAEEFINIINNVSALSKNLGMPVQQLHRYILQKKLELEKVESKTEDAEIKLLQVLQHYNVTMNDLEKYIKIKH